MEIIDNGLSEHLQTTRPPNASEIVHLHETCEHLMLCQKKKYATYTLQTKNVIVYVSFFIALHSCSVSSKVASSVRKPLMTSTRGITGTGFLGSTRYAQHLCICI